MTGDRGIRLALCQMKVTETKEANLEKAALFIARAKDGGADIVVLPEMFNCPYDKAYFGRYAEDEDGSTVRFLREQSEGVLLIGGSIPEREGDLVYNTCFVFEDGRLLGRYRKIHLFDVDYDGFRYKESESIAPGTTPLVVDSRYGRIALAICFDLRFPDLFRTLEKASPFLYVLPAAFNKISGPAHYRLLGRARALDQESFLALCSPASNPDGPYDPYGHSLVVGPWGEVLGELDDGEGLLLQQIDPKKVDEIRRKLPLKKQSID